jgi:hypothetical protein
MIPTTPLSRGAVRASAPRRPGRRLAAAGGAAALLLAGTAGGDTTPPPPTLPPPPAVVAVGTQAGFGEQVVLGPGARIEPAPAATPVVARLLDGADVGVEAWSTGWSPGPHVAAVHVAGPAGAPEALLPLRFVFDPQPPTLQWEVGTTALLDAYGLDQDVERHEPPRRTMPRRDRDVPILWSPDGRRWLPLLPRDAEPDDSGAIAEWLIATDRPQVFLWALRDGSFGAGAPVAPREEEMVRVWSSDELSAVRDLRLRVRPGEGRDYRLEMVAADLVGNETTVTWPLGR